VDGGYDGQVRVAWGSLGFRWMERGARGDARRCDAMDDG
jgi:hypothetical protein